MKKELEMLELSPPHGVAVWPVEDSLTHLHAQICGPQDSPYENGIFKLDINIPARYPFEPPKIRFLTPVYHPNIDSGGRICLDALNMPPKGAWQPSLNLSSLLASILLLLAEPNAADGLMADITEQYKSSRQLFDQTARKMTRMHAIAHSEEKTEQSKRSLPRSDEPTAVETAQFATDQSTEQSAEQEPVKEPVEKESEAEAAPETNAPKRRKVGSKLKLKK